LHVFTNLQAVAGCYDVVFWICLREESVQTAQYILTSTLLNVMALKNSLESIVFRLKSMLMLRLFFLVIFLVSTIGFFHEISKTVYVFIAIYFAITIVYALLLRSNFNPRLFSYVQIFCDAAIVTLLIRATSNGLTGPLNNTFVVLYIIPILAASMLFGMRESVIVALFSSSLFVFIVLADYVATPVALRVFKPMELLYMLYLRSVTFCLVGFLCGYLSNLLHKKGEELTQLKSLHNQILSNMNSGVITTYVDNCIIYANESAESISGYTFEEMTGRRLADFFFTHSGVDFVPDETSTDNHDRQKAEVLGRTKAGREVPIGYNFSFIRDEEDRVVGKVMVFTDLTRVKELERQVRQTNQLKAVGEMAAGVAHEIRNPLASIRGSIEMLAEGLDCDPRQERLFSVLFKETERLNNITDQFLTYSRESKPRIERTDVSEILKDVIDLCSNDRAIRDRVEIDYDYDESAKYIMGDEWQLKQVFFNLVKNAVDAIAEKGRVSIVLDKECDRQDVVQIEVADTGCGINQADRERIFEPFFTTKSRGIGVGLPLAEKIIRNHSGRIDVESRPGQGSRFMVHLPAG
jgi:two-component system, NtrC family, sensor histidine kinase PilS